MSRDWQKDMEMIKAYLENRHLTDYPEQRLAGEPVAKVLHYWLQEAEKWRREAFRKYPTPEAYDAACKALHKHRERADKLQTGLSAAKEEIARLNATYYADHQRFINHLRELVKTKVREQKLREAIEEVLRDATKWENPYEGYSDLQKVLDSLYPKEEEAK